MHVCATSFAMREEPLGINIFTPVRCYVLLIRWLMWMIELMWFICPGRLKVIALASAVGVSIGLISLTVVVMIRWLYVYVLKWWISDLIISRFFCSKNMHRVDTENLEEEKQVITFFIFSSVIIWFESKQMIVLIKWVCAFKKQCSPVVDLPMDETLFSESTSETFLFKSTKMSDIPVSFLSINMWIETHSRCSLSGLCPNSHIYNTQ